MNIKTVTFKYTSYNTYRFSIQAGIYTYSQGTLRKVVDEDTPSPEGGVFGPSTSYAGYPFPAPLSMIAKDDELTFLFGDKLPFYSYAGDQITASISKLPIPINFREFISTLEDYQLNQLMSLGLVNFEEEKVYFQEIQPIAITNSGKVTFRGLIWEPFANRKMRIYIHDGLYTFNKDNENVVVIADVYSDILGASSTKKNRTLLVFQYQRCRRK